MKDSEAPDSPSKKEAKKWRIIISSIGSVILLVIALLTNNLWMYALTAISIGILLQAIFGEIKDSDIV